MSGKCKPFDDNDSKIISEIITKMIKNNADLSTFTDDKYINTLEKLKCLFKNDANTGHAFKEICNYAKKYTPSKIDKIAKKIGSKVKIAQQKLKEKYEKMKITIKNKIKDLSKDLEQVRKDIANIPKNISENAKNIQLKILREKSKLLEKILEDTKNKEKKISDLIAKE
jgi:hypothetical protein